MTLAWYFWLPFAASWLFSITFWVKSSNISQKWLRITFVIAGIIAFLLPFFWGWLVS
ncbi:NADH-quinone oxidoreductase subunit L [Streptococcus sp. 45]|uniref:NADH-quinone oxidoreductase subunit L n=1 Tax=Streptococcus sp. 45 TaxID=1855326 RepID=UPI0009434BE2|nr:NADH-quinone oxidoreductase subunit L [Streptococcus sp. 45]